jgi:hypothetical protein
MTTQTTSTSTPTVPQVPPKQQRTWVRAAVCGAVLTLATVTAVGAWQLAAHGHHHDRVGSAQVQPSGTGTTGSTVQAATDAPATATLTVFLVGSPREASALRRSLKGMDDMGELRPTDLVLVVGSSVAAAEARQFIKDLRLEYGEDNVHVADLRAP